MTHEQVRERLSDYIEGSLSEEEHGLVEEHLTTCDSCRAELDALEKTLSMLSSLAPLQAPEGFASSVRYKMRRRGRRQRRTEVSHGLRQKVPYETTAVIMLFIVMAIYLMLFIFRSLDFEFEPSPPKEAVPSRPQPRPMSPGRNPPTRGARAPRGPLPDTTIAPSRSMAVERSRPVPSR